MQPTCRWVMATFVTAMFLYATAQGDEPNLVPQRGALGSGANIGQAFSGLPGGQGVTPSLSPFNQGIGQIVSGWTHQGITGTELANRIHQLQAARFDRREDLRERMQDLREDQREFSRDRREDQREFNRDGNEDQKEFQSDRKEDQKESVGEKIGSLGGKKGNSFFRGEAPGDHFNPGRFGNRGSFGKFGKFSGRGRR